MKTVNKIIIKTMQIALVLMFVFSCTKDETTEVYQEPDALLESEYGLEAISDKEIPQEVLDQLEATKENLAKYMGSVLQIVDYKIIGKVPNAKSLNKTFEAISKSSSTVAYGNIMDPETVVVGDLNKLLPSKTQEGSDLLKDYASDQIKVGDKAIELTWSYKGETFKTTTFYNDQGITWDNLMIGLIMMNPVSETELKNNANEKAGVRWNSYKRSWYGNWLWGSRRGTIYYEITVYHTNGTVSNTDITDYGHMNIGSAKSESRVLKETGSYGRGQYALGLCTPIASLKFNDDKFEVSVSGVGSNIISNGTKSLYPN
ncbi:hypothetical protein [uncultured Aquimarina sp.]|uniref:hypothetical protein n=1 Tax=uncultured Aquimarina sp. TaxID=575652 RepID=UPI00262BECC4|nr:hypothetical protein [uncultured Aquimarina sp.]